LSERSAASSIIGPTNVAEDAILRQQHSASYTGVGRIRYRTAAQPTTLIAQHTQQQQHPRSINTMSATKTTISNQQLFSR